jgi:predicted dehydrogenase
MPTPSSPPTRRAFLKKSFTATGAALFPLIVPAHVLGRGGGVAPSNRITLGGIGIGPRGKMVLATMLPAPDMRFIATCDIQSRMRDSVKASIDERYGDKACTTYRDFRDLLARPDLDAVLISTGDRWHALASILAAKAGKDVYSEKPCGLTIGNCNPRTC